MKSNITAKTLLFLILALFSVQCEERCPEFNTDILSWAPYKAKDTLSLKNNSSFANLVVIDNQVNHGEADKFRIGCVKCSACDQDDYTVRMTFNSTNIRYRFNSSNHPANSTFSLENWDHSYTTSSYTDSTFNNYIFNGITYDHVMIYKFSGQNSSEIGIEKIIVAKSFGIIAIFDNLGIWYLNSYQIRKIKISDIQLNAIEGC